MLFKAAISEHLSLLDVGSVNVSEMSTRIQEGLLAFIRGNAEHLTSFYAEFDQLVTEPFNIRAQRKEHESFIVIRWVIPGEETDGHLLTEFCDLIANTNEFNDRHQMSDVDYVILIYEID